MHSGGDGSVYCRRVSRKIRLPVKLFGFSVVRPVLAAVLFRRLRPRMSLDVASVREQFPALRRKQGAELTVYLDAPAGTQVPRSVADAMADYLLRHNANRGGHFTSSRETDQLLSDAHRAVADLVGTRDPDCVVFGPNMTSLTFQLSRSLARTWKSGEEVIVTRAEHDANFTPWVMAARDAGVRVREIEINPDDGRILLSDLKQKLSERTRLVAVGCASNFTGSIQPFREVIDAAHQAGAHVFLDAVQLAPHRMMDVDRWGCDFLTCSAYKFFGPHVGVLWGRRDLLESLPAYKVRPAPDGTPGRWMTGTQNHEGIVGTLAAVDYLAELGERGAAQPLSRREALCAAFSWIQSYESDLVSRLLEGLARLDGIAVCGITDAAQLENRVPTVSFLCERCPAATLATRLAERGIFVWHGNFYALPLSSAMGLEPDGVVRVGLVHYNTTQEVDRLLETFEGILKVV